MAPQFICNSFPMIWFIGSKAKGSLVHFGSLSLISAATDPNTERKKKYPKSQIIKPQHSHSKLVPTLCVLFDVIIGLPYIEIMSLIQLIR